MSGFLSNDQRREGRLWLSALVNEQMDGLNVAAGISLSPVGSDNVPLVFKRYSK